MRYKLLYSKQFLKDVEKHKKSGQSSNASKIYALLAELREHPRTGTGMPEQLDGNRKGEWSRHITIKHRLIYKIHEDVVEVSLNSAYGHYGDK
jgi:toxin YoeB